jgi:hypothetical protein
VLFERLKGLFLIGFRGAFFFCFFSFGRAKEKKKGRVKTNYRNQVQSFLNLFFITLVLDYFIL